ncbi:MAG: protein-tyrosine phosphatase [Rhodospirillaceae bacterium]|nr:MAG: protein-tyrosine phosphatase [Rhodospirillaceae bacterium]
MCHGVNRPFRVLFVCTGNICRSPTAEGLFRAAVRGAGLLERIEVDSAGIDDWHVGDGPDARAVAAARRRGIDISVLRARQVERADFSRFDLILAMDRGHLSALTRSCPRGSVDRLRLFLSFAPESGDGDIPDPYYGGPEGFERVLDMIEAGTKGLLAHIRRHLATAAER